MPSILPRSAAALLLALLLGCAVLAGTAQGAASVHLTPTVKGGGTITTGNTAYQCTGPLDDRQVGACPAIDAVNDAQWAFIFLQLIATPPAQGQWTFVGWEDCASVSFTICTYSGLDVALTGAPRAVFDDAGGPTVSATPAVSQTTERTVSFALAADEPGISYQCGIDGGNLSPCASGKSYTLQEGSHTFAVQGTDASGNQGAAASVAFRTVDTALVDGPKDLVTSKTAAFTFSSVAGQAFDCSLDGAAFTACALRDAATGRGSKTFAGLAEGSHTLKVRARDGDHLDAIPVTRSWTVDSVAPASTLDPASGPREGGLSTGTSETFAFTASEAGGFECRVDGGDYGPCGSPRTVSDLAPGPHSFEVRAVDKAGNVDTTPERRSWTTLRDADGDGFESGTDCNDGDARVNPRAADTADNGVDENCDGADAVNFDRDGDGIPRPADCDDARGGIRPGALDVPANGTDEDCDGRDAALSAIPFTLRFEASSYGRKATRFVVFAVNGVPAGATMEATCKRCPKPARRIVKRNAKGLVPLKPLVRAIRAGATIQVKVSKPGMVTTVRTLTVRAAKGPELKVACLPAGASKAVAC